jgi:hypothetical protein
LQQEVRGMGVLSIVNHCKTVFAIYDNFSHTISSFTTDFHCCWRQPNLFCSCQFTKHLNLAQYVIAWFMQQDGKAGIHRSKNILYGSGFVIHIHYSCCVFNREMLFLTVIQNRAFTDCVILTSLPSCYPLCKMLRCRQIQLLEMNKHDL